jgi:hypothetical protein
MIANAQGRNLSFTNQTSSVLSFNKNNEETILFVLESVS